ncbi:hypothetical protein P3L10_001669 [Capsicum annuum]
MHNTSSGRSYVPFGTGNPVDYHGPRKQGQVCTYYAPHTFRPPTDIGTSRLSSGTPYPRNSSPHLYRLRLRDNSDSDVQTSTPLFSEPWVLPRVASVSGSSSPPPPVVDDTDAHFIGQVPGDKDRLGRVFIKPDGST